MIHKNRGNRRKQDFVKAIRKSKISKEIYHFDWYNNLHQFSKNKIHCSCPMCTNKTNNKRTKCYGPTNNYKISEFRTIVSMNQQLNNYLLGEEG